MVEIITMKTTHKHTHARTHTWEKTKKQRAMVVCDHEKTVTFVNPKYSSIVRFFTGLMIGFSGLQLAQKHQAKSALTIFLDYLQTLECRRSGSILSLKFYFIFILEDFYQSFSGL